MEMMVSFLDSSWFNLLLLASFIVLIVITVLNILKIKKLKRDYKHLTQLMGKGEDFNEIFNRYMSELDDVSRETTHLKDKIEGMEKNMEKCVQKVGVIRYSAYKNAGNDLCFAIALLDFEDNGLVINGIYSRDNTTTTYAKPIEHGKSKYPLVKEEEEAVELAKHSGYKCFLELH